MPPCSGFDLALRACGGCRNRNGAKGGVSSGTEPESEEGLGRLHEGVETSWGARGGARLGKPRCVRILRITVGSSMAARMVNVPPHWGQVVISISKTRLSKWAQLRLARVKEARVSPSPLAASITGSAAPGTIWDRRAAWGARTPAPASATFTRLYRAAFPFFLL